VYVSELPSAASVSLATHPHQPSNTTKYYWSRPVRRPLQEQLHAFQIPESSWNSHTVVFSQAGYVPVVLLRPGHQFLQSLFHASQFAQTCSASWMAFDVLWGQRLFASACRSSICMDSPPSVVRDMAMHQPASWIVSFKGDDDEAVPRQQNHITPRRIYQSEIE
jgi:hypothetical protein